MRTLDPVNAGMWTAGYSGPETLRSTLLVGLLTATDVHAVDFHSNGAGTGFAPIPIPSNPFLAGAVYYAQALWVWPAPCGLGPFQISTSNGLQLAIGA